MTQTHDGMPRMHAGAQGVEYLPALHCVTRASRPSFRGGPGRFSTSVLDDAIVDASRLPQHGRRARGLRLRLARRRRRGAGLFRPSRRRVDAATGRDAGGLHRRRASVFDPWCDPPAPPRCATASCSRCTPTARSTRPGRAPRPSGLRTRPPPPITNPAATKVAIRASSAHQRTENGDRPLHRGRPRAMMVPFAIYRLGLALAPSRPVPSTADFRPVCGPSGAHERRHAPTRCGQ